MTENIDPRLLDTPYPPGRVPMPVSRTTDRENQSTPLYHPHYVLCTDGYYRLPMYYAPEQALTYPYPEPTQVVPGPGPAMPVPPHHYYPSYYALYPQPPEMTAEPFPQPEPQPTYHYPDPSLPPTENLWWGAELPVAAPELTAPTPSAGLFPPLGRVEAVPFPSPCLSTSSCPSSPLSSLASDFSSPPASSPSSPLTITLGTPMLKPTETPISSRLRPRSARRRSPRAGSSSSANPDSDRDRDRDRDRGLSQPLSKLVTVSGSSLRDFVHRGANERMVHRSDGSKDIARPMNAFMLYRKFYQARACRVLGKGQGLGAASRIIGASWRAETKQVRAAFVDYARIERRMHEKLFPDYEYRPRRGTRRNDDESE